MNRRFKGVWIPREIWESKELSITDRCLLAEIDSLCDTPKGCYASNSYFANFFGVSERTISRSVKNLEEMELINVRLIKRKTGSERFITTRQIVQDPLDKLSKTHSPNCLPINKVTNNTSSTNVEDSLFPKETINRMKKSVFRNSDVYLKKDIVKKNHSDIVPIIQSGVDIDYYMEKVKRWSDTKTGVKRNFDGWLGTVINFMEPDKEKGKLKMSVSLDNQKSEMLDYLNRD